MPDNALIIHTPNLRYHTYPFRDISFVNFLPMGLIPVADYAGRNGCPTKILHYGLARLQDRDFDIITYIRELEPKVVGLSLHWFLTSNAVIRLAEKIKKAFPDIFIVLGGYTSSYFAKEILEDHPCVDGIVRGDGEKGFLGL